MDLAQSDAETLARRERRWTRIGIPPRVFPTLHAPQETPALASVKAWLESPKTILLLSGFPDRGKTVAACWALFQTPGPCRFLKSIDVVRHGTFDGDFWDGVNGAPLVVLDDLGTEPVDEKGYAMANLQALWDRAYDGLPRLVATTNLGIASFSERYLAADGGRAAQRLRECGHVVEFMDGNGFRPKSLDVETR